MPKRTDIKSILIIGAGPIVIGQACEFDYSGTQACKALKEEGFRVILVNSNPATIMTDPELADATYIEPITPEVVAKIIAKERPDALLPTMGGQTALNTALSLQAHGRARPLFRRDDRRRRARHRQGRGPRAVSRGHAQDRPGNAEVDAGQRHRRQERRPQEARGRARRAEGGERLPTSTPRSTRWRRSGTSARATASSAT